MSHELRTPLNAIGGYAQLIEMGLRGPITEEQRVDLLKIQRSKNHLDGLVSDVLNFAKMGSGKLDLRVRPISIRQTVDAVIEMVAPQLVQNALHLEPYDTPNDGRILADVDRTRQILLNLFANALKFTASDGTITPGVRMEPDVVMISVRDSRGAARPDLRAVRSGASIARPEGPWLWSRPRDQPSARARHGRGRHGAK